MIAQNNFGVLELIMTPQDLKQIGGLIDRKLVKQTKKLEKRSDQADKILKELELEARTNFVQIIALGSLLRQLEKKIVKPVVEG